MLLYLHSLSHIWPTPANLTTVMLMFHCSLFLQQSPEKSRSPLRLTGCDIWGSSWGGSCWKAAFPSSAFPTLQREEQYCFFRLLLFFWHSFTLPKAGKPWLVSLRLAKRIFAHAPEKIWAKLELSFIKSYLPALSSEVKKTWCCPPGIQQEQKHCNLNLKQNQDPAIHYLYLVTSGWTSIRVWILNLHN